MTASLNRIGRSVVAVSMGGLVIAGSARMTFALPGADLPQTAQTIGVLLVGSVLGSARGAAAVLLYLAAGAAGLPVFSKGAAGLETLLGPSAGYLLGFVCVAAALGWLADRQWLTRTWRRDVSAMLAAHGLILALGAAWLATRIGVVDAWSRGVAPFLVGAVVKSVVVAVLVRVAARRLPALRKMAGVGLAESSRRSR